MPLLGNKVFILKKGNNGFLLELTNEHFDSEDELHARLNFYTRTIWTCRCTGRSGLSYLEACNNETRMFENLSRSFPTVFEAALLHFVHLSKSPLPPLIDGACKMLAEQFFINEPVEFRKRRDGQVVRGRICHFSGSTSVINDPCLINFHQYEPSNNKVNSYTVKLDNCNKLVLSVPFDHMTRLTHVPSRESIRIFIRCNCIRYGVRPESPWIVDEIARERVGIPDIAYPEEIQTAIRSHTVYSEKKHPGVH